MTRGSKAFYADIAEHVSILLQCSPRLPWKVVALLHQPALDGEPVPWPIQYDRELRELITRSVMRVLKQEYRPARRR